MRKKQESIKICQENIGKFRGKVLFLQGETISITQNRVKDY